MSKGSLSMRKIREILRLKFECQLSNAAIGKSVVASSSTVSECLRRFKGAQLSWPLEASLDDAALNKLLYPPQIKRGENDRGVIDFVYLNQQLKRKHVTLQLLWEEYRAVNPKGLGYSWFCDLYRDWCNNLDVWMRQTHKAGEKCFVDYCGQTIPILIDHKTGEIVKAQIFVMTLGASNYTFAEATLSQQLPDWIASHVNAFEFFGGVPEIAVIDNLRSGVNKAHRYEPDVNLTYQDLAAHYGVAILPARAATPQDKAKVENAVQQIQRALVKLRDQVFCSLNQLNSQMKVLVKELNERPFQKLPGSRLSQFETLDKPCLKPLPATRYVYADWKKARAGADYHVELEKHYYSVPYLFAKKELLIRYTTKTIEVFSGNKRIASHLRQYKPQGHTTVTEHMPKRHQAYAQWTPERIINWGNKVGVSTAQLLAGIIEKRAHPQQAFRSCLGILRLEKSYGTQRLEKACLRALTIGAYSYKSVESILKNNLETKEAAQVATTTLPDIHEYIRGKDYFH